MTREWYKQRHIMLWSRLTLFIKQEPTINAFNFYRKLKYDLLKSNSYVSNNPNSCFICDYMIDKFNVRSRQERCGSCNKLCGYIQDSGCLGGLYGEMCICIDSGEYDKAYELAKQIRDSFPKEDNNEQ